MWYVTLLCFLITVYIVGYALKESFETMLPVGVGSMVLILYFLALCKNMTAIGTIAAVLLAIYAIAFLLMARKGRIAFIKGMKDYYINPVSVPIIIGLVAVGILTSGHIAKWWDDLNYWATDIKALYYLNGFAGKYGNVAPEFGDYPPAAQIMKWCMTKISPSYNEGLAFAGYYVGYLIMALPVMTSVSGRLDKLKGKCIIIRKTLITVAVFTVIFLIPGIINDVWRYGTCADLLMGICYGSALISILDMKNHTKGFYFYRVGLFLSIAVLTKTVGVEWVAFAVVFWIVYSVANKDKYRECFGAKYHWGVIAAVAGTAVCEISWWVNCLLNRRIAKLTGSGVRMVTDGYSLPDNTIAKAKLFIEGFIFYPMHTDKTVMLDISQLTMLVIILAVPIILVMAKKMRCKEAVLFESFAIITALISYGAIFLAHISIFAPETQYESADVMAISISRYAAPFTVGMIMLLIYIVTDRCVSYKIAAVCMLFVLLTTDYMAAYDCLWGYKATVETDRADRESMIDDAGRKYVDVVAGDTDLWGHRVLFLRDDTQIHWVKDTYINSEVAPVPTVYGGINSESMSSDDIADTMRKSHAEYLYVQKVDGDVDAIMEPFMENGNVYAPECVYTIEYAGDEIILRPHNCSKGNS